MGGGGGGGGGERRKTQNPGSTKKQALNFKKRKKEEVYFKSAVTSKHNASLSVWRTEPVGGQRNCVICLDSVRVSY